ncbi:MAG: dolichyl-phosphate mannose synthase-like protein [Parcubacteria group bacterium Gr01-1014_31]|nr:MAG: dolichyl-phosphate mannose synthase-like protein [Parcubacteria group bacterium Gr01-1014_31]
MQQKSPLPVAPVVTVVMPVYNEAATVGATIEALQRAYRHGPAFELVAVDDGSTDGSRAVLQESASRGILRLYVHEKNRGKGAALRTGIAAARGQYLVIQDADAEYDPQEHDQLIAPLREGYADVVYGNRMHDGNPVGYWRYWFGNFFISWWCSLLFYRRVHDVETGFKAFRRELADGLELHADRFDFEVEFTARVLQRKFRLVEVPISYHPRRFSQGKKITWRDGVQALWLLWRYRREGK